MRHFRSSLSIMRFRHFYYPTFVAVECIGVGDSPVWVYSKLWSLTVLSFFESRAYTSSIRKVNCRVCVSVPIVCQTAAARKMLKDLCQAFAKSLSVALVAFQAFWEAIAFLLSTNLKIIPFLGEQAILLELVSLLID